MTHQACRRFACWIVFTLGILASSYAQCYRYQDGFNGYTGADEVGIVSTNTDASRGDNFAVREVSNSVRSRPRKTHFPQ